MATQHPIQRQHRTLEEKTRLVAAIKAALAQGSTLEAACAAHDVVASSYYNWTKGKALGRGVSKSTRKLVAMGPKRAPKPSTELTAPRGPRVINVHLDSTVEPDRLKICVLNGPTADVLRALELMR